MSEKKNILQNISKSFVTSSVIDTAVLSIKTLPKYDFHVGDKDFQAAFCKSFKEIVRDNAISSVTYYASIEIMQRSLNKENDFSKRLYIRMGSAAISNLAVQIPFYREKGFDIVLSTVASSSIEFISTIFSEWSQGGEEYTKQYLPPIHNALVKSGIFDQFPFKA